MGIRIARYKEFKINFNEALAFLYGFQRLKDGTKFSYKRSRTFVKINDKTALVHSLVESKDQISIDVEMEIITLRMITTFEKVGIRVINASAEMVN